MDYDLIIIGSGPAGLSAGIYAGRYALKTLVLGAEAGGTANYAHRVENYPGFPSITGIKLMSNFKEHALSYAEIKHEKVLEIKKTEKFSVTTSSAVYTSKAIIVASGTERRKLNIGEDAFIGRGVSYCATCDAAFFRNRIVAVAGGNDSAAMSALLLSEYASKVYIIYRKEKIRAEPFWLNQIEKNSKITIINSTNIISVKGDKMLEEIELDRPYSNSSSLKVDGLFIEIGSAPSSAFIRMIGAETDEQGYVIVDSSQATNIKGAYFAGDITTGSGKLKQIITAAAEGAIAAHSAYKFIKK